MKVIKKTIPICMLALACTNAFCVDSSSSAVLPTSSGMTLCPKLSITGESQITATKTNQDMNLKPGYTFDFYTQETAGGGWGYGGIILLFIPLVFGGGSINFDPTCPPHHPYLRSIDETWGGSWVPYPVMPGWSLGGGGGATMTVTCGLAPLAPTMTYSVGYNPSNPAYNTWEPTSTDCP